MAVLLADRAILVLDDVLDTVATGGFAAVRYRLVLGGVTGTKRTVRTLAPVLPLAIFVVSLNVTWAIKLPFCRGLFTRATLHNRTHRTERNRPTGISRHIKINRGRPWCGLCPGTCTILAS